MINSVNISNILPIVSETQSQGAPTLSCPGSEEIVLDQQAIDFKNFAHFANTLCPRQDDVFKIKSALPLLNLLQNGIIEGVYGVSLKDPSIFKKILEKDDSTIKDFQKELFISLDSLKTRNNPIKIICLFKNITKHIGPSLKSSLEHIVLLFNRKQLDLFMKPPVFFIKPELKFSSQELYRIAITSIQYLFKAVYPLHAIVSTSLRELLNLKLTSIIFKLGLVHQLNIDTLKSNHILSDGQKRNVIAAFSRVIDKFDFEENTLASMGKVRILESYYNTVQSEEVNKITLSIQNPSENSQDYNQRYVQDNLEIYENFICLIEEIHDNWISSSQKAIEYCAFAKDFSLYLLFGDMEKLKERLDKKPFPSQIAIETILFDEVKDFSLALKKMPLLEKVLAHLKDPKLAPLLPTRGFFQKKISFMEEIVTVVRGALAGPLEFAKQCENNLFIQPPLGRVNQSLKSEKGFLKKRGTSKATYVREPEISPPSTIASSSEIKTITPSTVSSAECLEELRALSEGFVSSKNKFEGLGTKEALFNAKAHLNDLLCVLGRVIESQDKPLSTRDLHAFVIDCVRHGILACEQMLAALVRQSSRFTSEEQLREHYSHNFYFMLGNCKFKAGLLPRALRAWVGEVNRGEIIVRNLDQCQFGNGSLQKLLTKLNYFMSGNKAFPAEEVFSETMEFCKKSAVFYVAIQKQIDCCSKDAEKTDPEEFLEKFKKIIQLFESQSYWDRISTSSLISPAILKLGSFQKLLEDLKENLQASGIAHSLDNVINHLFFHLETEVAVSRSLNLIMIHLHCQNLLLLPQLIVKEVLLNLISISQNFSITQELDVWSLIQILGIDIKCFTLKERQFLQDGKSIRQLARYPYSYSSKAKHDSSLISSIQKILQDSKSLQNKEKFTNDYKLEEGYQIGNSKLKGQINYIHKTLEEYVEISFSVLEKIVSNCPLIISPTQTM
jgi:hypothetical protein